MEKDKTIHIATLQAKKTIEKTGLKIKIDAVYNEKKIKSLLKKEIKKVFIYDITNTKIKNKIIHVNDHINKTGKNPLIGNQKNLKTAFPDITKIYKQKKQGVITTSLGKRATKKQLMKTKFSSTTLSNISIFCYARGIEKIEAKLINLFNFSSKKQL